MKKISILTLGCKVNQYESNAIGKELEDNDFAVVYELCEDADAFVLNTCAVTNEAEKKSRGMIAKIRKLSSAPIYICGCSSQNNPERFKNYSNIKAIYGTSSKQELVKLILENTDDCIIHSEISSVYEDSYFSKGDRTRVVMKIQEGCNNFCSYCLIPYLRGRERSRNLESIKKEIQMHSKTAKEIVFTGINLSHYGHDLTPKLSLINIVQLMQEFQTIRFRFSSLEQDIITDEFLTILKQSNNFAPHFHLSLQSGCDNTLKSMNRKYLSNEYFRKVELIRKYFESPAITTDIIVGFPTETEEDFEDSYNFAKKCKFAKIHAFPYSLRSGTVAERFKNVATNVKERATKLGALDKQLQKEYIDSQVGKVFTIITETQDDGEIYVGHTENFIKCYVKSPEPLKLNEVYKVKIEKFYKDGAIASIV